MLDQQISAYIAAHEEEAYSLLTELAQIPAPSNHEEKRMAFCRDWLIGMGAKGVYTDSAMNVIYPCRVEEDSPVVVIMAHMDVVFPDTEPLPLRVAGDQIFCPGIGDDTANLAALMMAAKYVTESGLRPKEGGVLFVCNTGEEGMGNLKGSRAICQAYAGRIKEFISLDGTMEGIVNCAVGSERFRVTVKTEGGHSYGRFGNANAIAKLAAIIQDIYGISVPKEGKTTYNVGTIEGGTSVNSIAQEASMLCEYRSDRWDGLLYMKEKFADIFAAHEEQGVSVSVELVGSRPCEDLDEGQEKRRNEMIGRGAAIIRSAYGKEPRLGPGSTDCNIPLSLGIPSVCYGAYIGDGAHTRQEYVLRSSLRAGYQVAFASVLHYFQLEETGEADLAEESR